MKIVFFGSDNFALVPLKALINAGYQINCVVTQPDRKKGRGLALGATPVKQAARDAGLVIYQPESVNAKEAVGYLEKLQADLFVVIAYGQILSQEVLDMPERLAINLHASLLPKYRGAAPVNWALINGEKETGVTVIKIIKEMDAGAMILRSAVAISDEDNVESLEKKLSKAGSAALLEALKIIERSACCLLPQDEKEASFAPRLQKKDGLINWNKPGVEVYNLIRGTYLWPGAYTYYKGRLLKIHKAEVSIENGVPGEVLRVDKESIVVACKKDSLAIKELQLEGGRSVTSREFIAGHKIKPGDKFYETGL